MATFAESSAPLQVDLRDQRVPSATPGSYTVKLSHVWKKPGGGADDALPPAEHHFEVRSAQVALEEGALHAQVPPPDATGYFQTVLPHVTLAQAWLPWDRPLSTSNAVAPEESADVPRDPWMAVLLFAAGELPGDPGADGKRQARTAKEFADHTDTKVRWPSLSKIDTPGDTPCFSIDVPAAVFSAVAPRASELRHLVHTRTVSKKKSAVPWYGRGEKIVEGDFSVVVSNRLPRAPGRYVAHLVSLEGWASALPTTETSGEATPETATGATGETTDTKPLRMISLHCWSFDSRDAAGVNFERALRTLAAPARTDAHHFDLTLKTDLRAQPVAGTAAWGAVERLAHGYVPLQYQLHTGERTLAWYRGPLTPFTTRPLPRPLPPATRYRSAEECHIYCAKQGVFDISYAAAWALGRAIVLADPELSGELNRARAQVCRSLQAVNAYLRHRPRATPEELAACVRPPTGQAHLARLLGEGLLQRLTAAPDAGAPPHAEAPPPTAARGLSHAWRQPGVREVVQDQMVRVLTPQVAEPEAEDLSLLCPPDPARGTDGMVPPGAPLTWPMLLTRVPFHYLVPDASMLLDAEPSAAAGKRQPSLEGLRLFHLDPHWLARLQDGALSVGIGTGLDEEATDALSECLPSPDAPVTGLLLSSRLVGAYPDMLVEACEDDRVLTALRRELTSDVLMMLFDGVPDTLTFREPGHGIHFGTADIWPDPTVALRNITGKVGTLTGGKLKINPEQHLHQRAGGDPDVLRLAGTTAKPGLTTDLCTELRCTAGDKKVTPAQLALQLTRSPLSLHLTRRTKG
ncbi:hypothetical protein [Streptomyces huiliensis]|uniref:hypothetical protein n=1 Tax=Streptomyces huiliensis TaxID=2876027 RepID=UPI001CBCA718|nr:hypothetical protein [Streptomyces huiliensis]MBZ4319457.1 hypothetical protein [Streptomyces huiliensis]